MDVDGSSHLSADSQPKSVGLVWGLAATRRSVSIHQMNRVNSVVVDDDDDDDDDDGNDVLLFVCLFVCLFICAYHLIFHCDFDFTYLFTVLQRKNILKS